MNSLSPALQSRTGISLHSPNVRRTAFTLVELLVVMAIIGVLMALLFPVAGRMRVSALTTASVSNLRQIHILMLNYLTNNNGVYPSSVIQPNPSIGYEPTWRRAIWESTNGPFTGDVMSAMKNSAYSKIMWCPLMTSRYGQTQHPAGQGSYSLNAFFMPTTWRYPNGVRTQTSPDTIGKLEPYIMTGTVLSSAPTIGTFYHLDSNNGEWSFPNYVYGASGDMMLGLFIDGHTEMISKAKSPELMPILKNSTDLR